MFYQLAPAGNPVVVSARAGLPLPDFLTSSHARFYASGTAALAAAICAAINYKQIKNAEIILPAYACQDLISAIVYAGARPVLVDFETHRPWLDLAQVSAAINENTAAIIGVNLFGISERWPLLRALADEKSVLLIEDSAQYFPDNNENHIWSGDFVVLSFGRGKPVSLLGGGAVYCAHQHLLKVLPLVKMQAVTGMAGLLFKMKAQLYNLMISPYVFWLPQALPFLHLGETRYHELHDIAAMDNNRQQLLAMNVRRYQSDVLAEQRCEKISAIIELSSSAINLPRVCDAGKNRRLLRYPFLLDAGSREAVFIQLQQAGLGVSKMYPHILPEIEGLQGLLPEKHFPQAQAFAESILTLPLHEKLKANDINEIHRVLIT